MSHLDSLDALATLLGACNNVFLTPEGALCGTNTDWLGIRGSLLSAGGDGVGRDALVFGAGGASRAAGYALGREMGCRRVYVVNRDEGEVKALMEDVRRYGEERPELVHVRSLEEVAGLKKPGYVVGSVPDCEPGTEAERLCYGVLEAFLSMEGERGVLLDMCYHPMETRVIRLGRKYGWRTVVGTSVVLYQLEKQWRLWLGDEKFVIPEELMGELAGLMEKGH